MAEFASIVHLLHHNFHIFPYPYHTTLFPFVQLLFFKQALEPAGVFCKDGTRYLVYILDFSAHVAPGTELFFAGGMSMDDDGWMDPGPGHILALSLADDEGVQLSFGYQSDIFPYQYDNQEFFQQDFSVMLTHYLMDQENS